MTITTHDNNGLNVRLASRGEAYCAAVIGTIGGKTACCLEPAAVAYRISEACRWSYACAEHYGLSDTYELRRQSGDAP